MSNKYRVLCIAATLGDVLRLCLSSPRWLPRRCGGGSTWQTKQHLTGTWVGNMAHILIATANPTQRRDFAALLKAARHHVVTTDDAVLALAALQETPQPLIVLLGEQLDPLQSHGQLSASDVLIHALESPPRTVFDHQHAQHAYIL